jgi:hypothetical protein
MLTIYRLFILVALLYFSGHLFANDVDSSELEHSLQLDQDGIKV